jgi:L-lactate dehydrogenase complex protein LldG
MSSRDHILGKLRNARKPFPDLDPARPHPAVTPFADISPAVLKTRFIQEAEALSAVVHPVPHDVSGIEKVLELIGEDRLIQCWNLDHIPLTGLGRALRDAGVSIAGPEDVDLRIGMTGAASALAATGSLVLVHGPGRTRAASLVPPVHIAVIRAEQILPDLESWVASQRREKLAAFQDTSQIVIVSGSSRTADIGKILILGAHGPATLHIVLVG